MELLRSCRRTPASSGRALYRTQSARSRRNSQFIGKLCSHRVPALLERGRGQVEGDEKVFEQVLNHANLVVQAVIALQKVQRRVVGLRKSHAVLEGDDVVAPT